MLQPPVTIPIAFVQGMLSGLLARGQAAPIDARAALEDAGIEPALLEAPGARVTAEQYVALFALLMERLDDEALCFLSRRLKRGSFALMTRATLGAPTFEVALRRVAHTFSLLQDDLTLVLLQDGPLAGFGLRLNDSAAVQQNFLHELMLRVYWRLLAWLHGGRLAARRFDFGFELPPYADGYAKVFPGPLQFGQPCTAVWFDAGALQTPVHRDAQAMNAFLAAAPANVILPRLAEQAVSARVRSVLQQNRPAWADLATAASSLHMSVSTLQRHLATEGTSFQSLKDQLRRDLAIVRLNTSTVPLAALAEELGFADSAAFQRAFKAWTGGAPGSYRRRRETGSDE
ncbi:MULTISPECIES: AraC family transcriptional regulator [Variovorax]|jgi:AraC-like DNA-binding protein|uniref:AraC family transcriptional regulator n=1 Tax=Variovorax TaxID=34072 RepID=UPI00086D8FE7|nr:MULTISPECIES: AraC family transcriptional regulator [Variovorax]MBN8756697.1 AraC family transcriptional regulator [Variovorax sp.]ODU13295.1 MAG: AraC family transcriptional regulator [Variovorax sp. SCN 67-85]ODV18449.1 MAG: AraC family transcriptional regulator [Variovorax sp. SCN 67-20]OJZ11628.1 MAG: AraC family transcriptional regulator [Variovorax sp. 67-131]UKI05711.1 AraC family transcriptional regulator [Variovorax paradoxus]